MPSPLPALRGEGVGVGFIKPSIVNGYAEKQKRHLFPRKMKT